MQFTFKTQPYEHQQEVFDASWDSRSWALFLEMGTGKTKVTIDTIAKLYCDGEIDSRGHCAKRRVRQLGTQGDTAAPAGRYTAEGGSVATEPHADFQG